MDAIDASIAHHARVASPRSGEFDASPRRQVVSGKARENQTLHRRECDLDVMIADDDDERASFRYREFGERIPDLRERSVVHDSLHGGLGFVDSDVTADVLGQRIEHIAVQNECHAAIRPLLRHPANEIREPIGLAQDLEAGFSAHVDVRYHMDFFECR